MGLRLICSKVFNRILVADISKVIEGFQTAFEEHIKSFVKENQVDLQKNNNKLT